MAGHSKFKNTIHRKRKQDQKKTKIFSNITANIASLSRSTTHNASFDSRLKAAVILARQNNIPKKKYIMPFTMVGLNLAAQ